MIKRQRNILAGLKKYKNKSVQNQDYNNKIAKI